MKKNSGDYKKNEWNWDFIRKRNWFRFNDSRVNKVNRRKEFFNITIDEVKQIVEENKADVHSFVEHPDAEEYYDTLKIEEQLNAK